MSIRARFYLLVLILSCLTVGTGLVATWALGRLEAPLSVAEQSLRDLELSHALHAQFLDCSGQVTAFLAGDASAWRTYEESRLQVVELLRKLLAAAGMEEDRALIGSLEEDLLSFELVTRRASFLAKRNTGQRSFQLLRDWLHNTLHPSLDQKMGDLEARYGARFESARQQARQSRRRAMVFIYASFGILVGVGLASVLLVRAWLLHPIQLLVQATQSIGEGNFPDRIPIERSDELGGLAREIEKMVDRVEAAQQQLVARERLAAVGEMTASVAHNLRNPLASIRATAQSTLVDCSDPQAQETLRTVIRQVDRCDRTLRSMLETLQPVRLRRALVDLGEVLQEVAGVAQNTATGRGVRVKVDVDDTLPPVMVDRGLFEQALLSLLFNATEASPDGGEVRLRSQHGGGVRSRSVLVVVDDDGTGMDEEHQRRVFEPSFTTKENGTGMGLYLARRIVRGHGGDIAIESEPGNGCRMRVSLPATQ